MNENIDIEIEYRRNNFKNKVNFIIRSYPEGTEDYWVYMLNKLCKGDKQ